ncbi:class I SAM-dependent methyltransferase [Acidocella sp.]|uniref:class I SAM-dependent methyltransferase n=1 Tax=Acidocella sp. TaxID=50710 RepID=UPI003D008981
MIWLYRKILDRCLVKLVRRGTFLVLWPDGSQSEYGTPPGFKGGIHIKDDATVKRLALNPGLALGEAYMDETLTPVNGTIHDVLCVLMDNQNDINLPILTIAETGRKWLRPILQANNAIRSKSNVAHHYDLNGRLYSLFLDRDRQYSCAYFTSDDVTLEDAQLAKKRHIAAKLKLDRPGLEVLDIGCGWGGMALTLAKEFGAKVTGITLSEEQLAAARARAKEEGLEERVNFELMDYRAMHRQFDRIVSVGMFEHVGAPNYETFFRTVKSCLKPDGVALIHSIGRFDGPGATNPWITKYIFPGGYSPAMSEVLAAVEKTGLRTADIEVLRLHYAKTLAHWRRRFNANRDTIASIYDERFCRMFEFYLSGSELAFRLSDHMNFQIQLVRQQDALPLTRDYIFEAERRTAQFASAGE